jgi:hypothetical protein
MKALKIVTVALIIGAVLGATATEIYDVYRYSHKNYVFEKRIHCKSVADSYVKEQKNDWLYVSLLPGKVDYSPARNSCVAGVETTIISAMSRSTDSIVDPLSEEILFSKEAKPIPGYNQPTDFDLAFDYVLKNTGKPTDLQKKSDEQITNTEHEHGPWEKY